MDKQETGYDYIRYKQLLAEAVDETKRLELIETMIRENARDRLEPAFSAPVAVAITSRIVRHFSEASIASEPTGPIRAQRDGHIAGSPASSSGLRSPLPSRRAAQTDVNPR